MTDVERGRFSGVLTAINVDAMMRGVGWDSMCVSDGVDMYR